MGLFLVVRCQSGSQSAYVCRGTGSAGDGVRAFSKTNRMRAARGDINEVSTIGVGGQFAIGARGGNGHHLRVSGRKVRCGNGFIAGGSDEEYPVFVMGGDDALEERAGLISPKTEIDNCGSVVHCLGNAIGDIERVGSVAGAEHIHRKNPDGALLHPQIFVS